MDLMELGAKLLSEKTGTQVDQGTVVDALGGLLGDGQGNVDFGALAAKVASSGQLGGILNSWLGDGANSAISAEDILGIFGAGNVADFASKLGTNPGDAAGGLADVLPELMDKASSGGNILDSLGGAEGLLGAAKSLFGNR
ncbi:MAG: hypothetical protein HKN19_01270 [Halioglobus sp.]|nr:hypothetical protein [Halioglobus sp.]